MYKDRSPRDPIECERTGGKKERLRNFGGKGVMMVWNKKGYASGFITHWTTHKSSNGGARVGKDGPPEQAYLR